MTSKIDPLLSDRISAYLDGMLPEADRVAVEAKIAADPAAAAEFAALSRVDAQLAFGFQDMLARPVPLSLARGIEAALPQVIANDPDDVRRGPVFFGTGGLRAIAASLLLLGIGAAGGALVTRAFAPPVEVAGKAPGWLDQVAEYHAVYAAQGRHLVEVPASEVEHLETWLSETTGVTFRAPDLSAQGLVFQGGRLLVANGKPVAQLMYRDADGQVIAVCFLAGGDPAAGAGITALKDGRFGDFNLIAWKSDDASYVVIGPADRPDLRRIAEAASIAL
jgi:anti-sigma factor RsiW